MLRSTATSVSASGSPEMTDTVWLDDVFAAAMLAVALYSAGRLVTSLVGSRRSHRDVDAAHVLMGVSMAGQLVAELNPVPNGLWEATFLALSAWFAWRAYEFVRQPGVDSRIDDHVHRLSRRLIHLTMALAMLYMYLAAEPSRIGAGMAMGTATGTTADFVLIPTVFLLALLGSAIWQVDALGRLAPAAVDAGSPSPLPAPAGAAPDPAADDADGEPAPRWLAPRLEAAAHIVMVITMAYMLVLMV